MFANFSLVMTIKLLQTGSVDFGRYLFVLTVTLVNAGIVFWLGYILRSYLLQNMRMGHHQRPAKSPKTIQIPKQKRTAQVSYQARRQKAEHNLLKFAHHKNKLTMQDVMQVTGFDLIESQNLIDDLILEKILKSESQQDSFVYYFNSNPS